MEQVYKLWKMKKLVVPTIYYNASYLLLFKKRKLQIFKFL